AIDLHRELNALKQTKLGWMYDVSKCAPQEALRNLDAAFAHFFRRVNAKQAGKFKGKAGFPRLKSKKHGLGSVRLTGTIRMFERHIQLPRLGKLRLKERGYLPTRGVKILSATVSERAGRWVISVQVEMAIPDPAPADKPLAGVDLGVKALATVSDGTLVPNPHALKRNVRKVKRRQLSLSRKVKGSANRRKAVQKLANAHLRVANIRQNALHQATTQLAKTKSVVGVEDLNVSGMLKNHKLARVMADVGLSEFRRQLTYKAEWYGCRIVVADRFFPSSKRCAKCHHAKKELSLDERVFTCEVCGFICDRDLNAALNLEQLARTTASSAESLCLWRREVYARSAEWAGALQ
ncbi:MAG: transposase, partial [Candidatus Tectomicrobia bacterium]|nr:transposase [Candidatus Tectomicrobia bacterium]